jgi:PAS domain S-box-containing protein
MRAIDRLIEIDVQESATQQDRVAFLALMDAVVDALPDGLVVTNSEGIVILFNEKAEFMFGRHRSEIIGNSVEILMPERLRSRHANHHRMFNRFDIRPHAPTLGMGFQLTGIRSDGHEFPADITLSRMIVPKGIFNLALVRYSPRVIELAEAARAASNLDPGAEPVVDEAVDESVV